jgi:hypothetical protein
MENKDQWDLFLPAALMAYRTMVHNTTRYTPFFLTNGREATMPTDIEQAYPEEEINEENFQDTLMRRINDLIGMTIEARLCSKENIEKSQEYQQKHHNTRIRPVTYKKGDLVLEYRSWRQNVHGDKFAPKWNGPYRISQPLGSGAYILSTMEGQIIKDRPVHGDRLKLYHQRESI